MPLAVFIKIKEKRPLDITVREWPKILRESHEEMGHYWHEKVFPRHFAPGAERVYQYRGRTKKYLDYKQKTGHGSIFLVWSGLLRHRLTRGANIQGFPSRVTVRMKAGDIKYIPLRPRTAKQPPLHEEVTRITKNERKELAAVLKAAIVRRIETTRAARAIES